MKIAVVGISAELPSGSACDKNLNHKSFYEFLLAGRESYEEIPSDRLNVKAWQGKYLGQIKPSQGSFLKDVDLFDNVEFGVSTRDAQVMSPSTRKLIEHSFLALLDSGIDYRCRNVGCFAAGVNHLPELDEYDVQVPMACPPSMLANRISYHLDLTGPSIPIDTACSSTCTAFHLACNSIRSGDCEAAVVAGCQLNLGFLEWFHYTQGSMLASDGKCKPFDASADGFSRSEGIVAVVLKPLGAAIADNDHVYATVLGTGLTSTGAAAPIGAPVAEAQFLAMQNAFKQAERCPRDVDFIECHATGTAKGDPEEANWIIRHFGREAKLWLGSVKGNIGHTEISAFLVSLSKVISIMERGTIPPNINLKVKNPEINWDGCNVDIPVTATPLPCRAGERPLIAIASTGLGGVNGHVVVEGPPHPGVSQAGTTSSDRLFILTAGGLSPRSAGLVADSISKASRTNLASCAELACISGRRTRQMTWRTYTVVDPLAKADVRFPQAVLSPRKRKPIVLLFSGQGPQYADMGRELFAVYPIFKESILESDRTYRLATGKSLLEDYGLFGTRSQCSLSGVWPVEVTLPAIAAFQMALFDLLVDVGIKPDIVVGHSAGETAVLYASGAGPKAMAMDIAVARGRAFASMEVLGGTMAALSCGARQTEALIAACARSDCLHPAEIACYNAPDSVAISGGSEHIDAILEVAASYGIPGKRLKTNVPIHSSMIELRSTTYRSLMNDVFSRYPGSHYPQVVTYSPTTGTVVEGAFDEESFWLNARLPVRFTATLSSLSAAYGDSKLQFIEVSPHPVLSSYVSTIFQDAQCIVPCARRPNDGGKSMEQLTFLELVGQLLLGGYNEINFSRLNTVSTDPHEVPMEVYPFQPKSFSVYTRRSTYLKQVTQHHGPLNHPHLRINSHTHPSLAEHAVRQQPVMCLSGFLEMAFEFGANVLIEVRLYRLLSLSSASPLPVCVQRDGLRWSVKSIRAPQLIHSPSGSEGETLHAEGFLDFEKPHAPPQVDVHGVWSRCDSHITSQEFYSSLKQLDYGPIFRRIVEAHIGADEAIALVRCKDDDLLDHNYLFHPAILDACIQMCCFAPLHGNTDPNAYYLPDAVDMVSLHSLPPFDDLPDHMYTHCILQQWMPDAIVYDVTGCDEMGRVLFSLKRLMIKLHLVTPVHPVTTRYGVTFEDISCHYPFYLLNSNDGLNMDDREMCANPLMAPPDPSKIQDSRLWNPETDICLHYTEGGEIELQWRLSGLGFTQTLNIWITAMQGNAGDKATGITRALRKERPAWTIRLALFDPTFNSERKRAIALRRLSTHLAEEPEFVFVANGGITVPRLRPIQALLPESHRHIPTGEPSSIQALHSVCPEISACIPGLLVSVLAPSLSIFRNRERLIRMRVLLTHPGSDIGRIVSQIYHALSVVDLIEVCESATASELYLLGPHTFDLVISGHTAPHIYQVSQLLVCKPHGRLFFWNYGQTEIAALVDENPDLAHEALDSSLRVVEEYSLGPRLAADFTPVPTPLIKPTDLFSRDRSYMLIGGLGILGLHTALWMYERGAKCIAVTSRSGVKVLDRSDNKGLLRIVQYLQSKEDLQFHIAQFDASDGAEMRKCVNSLPQPLGGCFFMANSATDTIFMNLTDNDFSRAYRSTEGSFQSLQAAVDLSTLQFIVAISSISAIFGSPGQSPYASSKLALDGLLSRFNNASSFACPPVAGTALVTKVQQRRQNYMTKWQISIQDYLVDLEDIVNLIRCRQPPVFYIPELKWNELDEDIGVSRIGSHLLNTQSSQETHPEGARSQNDRLIAVVRQLLDISEEDLAPEILLTSFGLDSLSASRLSLILHTEFSVNFNQIRLLANTTLSDIQNSMLAMATPGLPRGVEEDGVARAMTTSLERLLSSPTKMGVPSRSIASRSSTAVLITGTTGALGSHLLHCFVRSRATIIYCLNRRHNGLSAYQRQRERLAQHGLPEIIVESTKIVCLDYEPGMPMLGLSRETLDELRSSVTHIVHNAWKSDFSASLEFFDDILLTTRSLLNIACTSTTGMSPAFVLISSIGVCQFAHSGIPVPEEFISLEALEELPSVKIADRSGYLQSKWVAEELVRQVGEASGIRTCVVRVGVLSGSPNGQWDTSQWFPTMVKSALYLGCLPSGTDWISWLPPNHAATAITEITFSSANDVVHLVHPRPTRWASVITEIADALNVPIVPYLQWFKRLEEDTMTPATLSHPFMNGRNPAISLLHFYKQALENVSIPRHPVESLGLTVRVADQRARLFSASLNDPDFAPLTSADALSWLARWRSIGFLPPP